MRYLHLGSPWVQGAMRIRKPQRVELEYVQRMLASILWLPTEALGEGRALQLGLGAGAITRFTRKALGMPTTVVELNPRVVDVCRQWFHLPGDDSARFEVLAMDAARLRGRPGARRDGACARRRSLRSRCREPRARQRRLLRRLPPPCSTPMAAS